MTVETAAPVDRLFAVVSDLSTYPGWLDVMSDAVPDTSAPDDAPAWFVTLRAAIGPFARSKRLRVERTYTDGGTEVHFDRRELDGREHAAWGLRARCGSTGSGSRLDMDLAYAGRLWTGPLDAVLDRQIDKALQHLPAYLG